jgi:hypothetical protein
LRPYRTNEGKKGYNFIFEERKNTRMDKHRLEKVAEDIEQYLNNNALTYFEARNQHGSMAPVRVQLARNGTIERYDSVMLAKNAQYKHKIVHDDPKFGTDFNIYQNANITKGHRMKIIDKAKEFHSNVIVSPPRILHYKI